jgi:hypothetical protein
VIEDLGGQVQVKSDGGTVFELTVPIH